MEIASGVVSQKDIAIKRIEDGIAEMKQSMQMMVLMEDKARIMHDLRRTLLDDEVGLLCPSFFVTTRVKRRSEPDPTLQSQTLQARWKIIPNGF